jgi:hypothetical protein
MQATPLYGESSEELVTAIRSSLVKNPSLGIIFSSVSLGICKLSQELKQFSFPIIGCSSSGEIQKVHGDRPISELSAVGCLINPSSESFRVELFSRGEGDSLSLGKRVGVWGREQFAEPIFIILISGLTNDGEQIIKGIEDSFLTPPRVYGGVAGDDGKFEETFVFLNGTISSDGVAVLLFDGTIHTAFSLITSGWRGVGAEKVITHSSGNQVYTIDDIPALDIYKKYLNLKEEDIPSLSVDFPLIVKRVDGSIVIRAPLAVDRKDRSLIFAGSVPQGSVVTFSSSPGKETIQNSVFDICKASDRIASADLILIFSCMARHQATGDCVIDEINAAAGSKETPMIGFFSYGEIGNNSFGKCEFYNETFTLVALSERKQS